jgi:predicted nucleic acid-binding protein
VTVVADTSVILNLCFLGQDPLLQQLFGTVHVPPQVHLEFLRLAAADPRFHELVFPGFIQLTTPLTTVSSSLKPRRYEILPAHSKGEACSGHQLCAFTS